MLIYAQSRDRVPCPWHLPPSMLLIYLELDCSYQKALLIGCAKGFSLGGFWEVRGFPFCGGKKGLRLPLAVGKRV